MARTFTADVILNLIDRMSGGLARAERNVKNHTNLMTAEFRRLERAGTGMVAGFAGLNAVTNQMHQLVDVMREFDKVNSQIAATSIRVDKAGGLLGNKPSEIAAVRRQVREEALKGSRDINVAPVDVENEVYALLQSGQSVEGSIRAAGNIVKLLKVTGGKDPHGLTQKIAGLATEFKLPQGTNEINDTYQRIANMLAYTRKSNFSAEDFLAASNIAGTGLAQGGVTLEEFAAMQSALASRQIRGSQAGVMLRSLQVHMEKPTKQAREALASLGYKMEDFATEVLVTPERIQKEMESQFGQSFAGHEAEFAKMAKVTDTMQREPLLRAFALRNSAEARRENEESPEVLERQIAAANIARRAELNIIGKTDAQGRYHKGLIEVLEGHPELLAQVLEGRQVSRNEALIAGRAMINNLRRFRPPKNYLDEQLKVVNDPSSWDATFTRLENAFQRLGVIFGASGAGQAIIDGINKFADALDMIADRFNKMDPGAQKATAAAAVVAAVLATAGATKMATRWLFGRAGGAMLGEAAGAAAGGGLRGGLWGALAGLGLWGAANLFGKDSEQEKIDAETAKMNPNKGGSNFLWSIIKGLTPSLSFGGSMDNSGEDFWTRMHRALGTLPPDRIGWSDSPAGRQHYSPKPFVYDFLRKDNGNPILGIPSDAQQAVMADSLTAEIIRKHNEAMSYDSPAGRGYGGAAAGVPNPLADLPTILAHPTAYEWPDLLHDSFYKALFDWSNSSSPGGGNDSSGGDGRSFGGAFSQAHKIAGGGRGAFSRNHKFHGGIPGGGGDPGKLSERGLHAMEYFISKGWSPHAAAIAAGNIDWESGGFNTRIVGDKSIPGGSHGYGQWNRDRWNMGSNSLQAFAKRIGKSWDDPDTQLAFYDWEWRNRFHLPTNMKDFSNFNHFGHTFEGYKLGPTAHERDRFARANKWLEAWKARQGKASPADALKAPTVQMPAGKGDTDEFSRDSLSAKKKREIDMWNAKHHHMKESRVDIFLHEEGARARAKGNAKIAAHHRGKRLAEVT